VKGLSKGEPKALCVSGGLFFRSGLHGGRDSGTWWSYAVSRMGGWRCWMIVSMDPGWVEASLWLVMGLVQASGVLRKAAVVGRCRRRVACTRLHRWACSHGVLSHLRRKTSWFEVKGQ
jgi:hypothetical protein